MFAIIKFLHSICNFFNHKELNAKLFLFQIVGLFYKKYIIDRMKVFFKYSMMPVHEEHKKPVDRETPLTDYLRLCGTNAMVKRLRYIEMPCFFRWDNNLSIWITRKRCVLLILKFLELK
jgi:hypothetical protein